MDIASCISHENKANSMKLIELSTYYCVIQCAAIHCWIDTDFDPYPSIRVEKEDDHKMAWLQTVNYSWYCSIIMP